ncbi:alkene reductase [Streptomyces sp. ICBB 8177]|uniref:alkene reductase n=1 Tax=Streptomyces sp. ICBB 8177 TaxID=563922 RepID=UPI001F5420F0|nr:alkene reductase [Streptomyces sp. ICBB 8177]
MLRPLDLGALRLPNRVVMAPLTRARATGGESVPSALHAAYYGQRASAGLIVTEGTWVSRQAMGFVDVPGIHSEAQVAAWREVTRVVHLLGGRIVLQLWHCGAVSHPDHLVGELPAGPSAVNPDEMSFTRDGFKPTLTPRAMTARDIHRTIEEYTLASRNARRAGFDGVEVAAHGVFLLAQFLNPRLNQRDDAYGGDQVRRRRLPLEVIDAVAEPWDGRGVGVRLSPYLASGPHFRADEDTLADHDALVAALADHPVAYLHLRGRDAAWPDGAPDMEALARYRRLFAGPLIANNGFDRGSGNAAIESGVADAVSFGRYFVANPDLVTRFAFGRSPEPGDPGTYYGGGPAGYTDYPVSV